MGRCTQEACNFEAGNLHLTEDMLVSGLYHVHFNGSQIVRQESCLSLRKYRSLARQIKRGKWTVPINEQMTPCSQNATQEALFLVYIISHTQPPAKTGQQLRGGVCTEGSLSLSV